MELQAMPTTAKFAGQAVSEVICGLDYASSGTQQAYVEYAEGARLGPIDVFRCHSQGLREVTRGIRHINRDQIDDFLLIAPLVTSLKVTQNAVTATVDPGSFVILATAQPFKAVCIGPQSSHYAELAVRVSGTTLRQQIPWVDRACTQAICIRPGTGRMMRSMLDQVLADGRSITAQQVTSISKLLIDAIAAVAAEAPELAEPRNIVRLSPQEHVQAAAIEYIKRNLGDPGLGISRIAQHCHVSIRYLHACFSHGNSTVGVVVRRLRLEQCRAELMQGSQWRQTISQLAMKWGFSNSSGFSRAYRAHFGIAPHRDLADVKNCKP